MALFIHPNIKASLSHIKNCLYCGAPEKEGLQYDHIFPVSKGGLSTPENITIACNRCNIFKSNSTIEDFAIRVDTNREKARKAVPSLRKRMARHIINFPTWPPTDFYNAIKEARIQHSYLTRISISLIKKQYIPTHG